MVACMARDSSIMGLCGETKIANKNDSWVTMIQGKGIDLGKLFCAKYLNNLFIYLFIFSI